MGTVEKTYSKEAVEQLLKSLLGANLENASVVFKDEKGNPINSITVVVAGEESRSTSGGVLRLFDPTKALS